MKVQCYGLLSHLKNAMDILSRDQFTSDLKKELDGEDPVYAAFWSSTMGMIAHEAGSNDLAKVWLDYGVSRDPNLQDLKQLSNMLGNK